MKRKTGVDRSLFGRWQEQAIEAEVVKADGDRPNAAEHAAKVPFA